MNDKQMNLIKFLSEKKIYIESYHKDTSEDNKAIEKKINNHITILGEFHNKCRGVKDIYSLGLSSFIWKDIEEMKVWNRRVERIIDINLIKQRHIVNIANDCIKNIYDIDYTSLIKRSMKTKEICIGKPYHSTIWKDSTIKILDVSKICFNMVEIDYYKYLRKLKRKGFELNWNGIIENIVILEKLNRDSYLFLKYLIEYPYEHMKNLQK
ncbi:MAG: hypothetical protein ACRC7R_05740, partial [Sarcina sp.]